MNEQKKAEIINKLNNLKIRINWWVDFKGEKIVEHNKKEAYQAQVVINTLSAEYWGIQYVLNQLGWEIVLDKNSNVEEIVNY